MFNTSFFFACLVLCSSGAWAQEDVDLSAVDEGATLDEPVDIPNPGLPLGLPQGGEEIYDAVDTATNLEAASDIGASADLGTAVDVGAPTDLASAIVAATDLTADADATNLEGAVDNTAARELFAGAASDSGNVDVAVPTAVDVGVPAVDAGTDLSAAVDVEKDVNVAVDVEKDVNVAVDVEKDVSVAVDVGTNLDLNAGVAVDVAHVGSTIETGTWNVPAPAIHTNSPVIHLPKGPREVVDVPHAPIHLPGNAIHHKDLLVNLPTPIVEAPKPIIRTKEVLFRVPQAVFYVPRPQVQYKPIVYRVGHNLRTYTPIVRTSQYLFQTPQAKITGKSAYSQPIPALYHNKY